MMKKNNGCALTIAGFVLLFGCVGLMDNMDNTASEATPLPATVVVPTFAPTETAMVMVCGDDMLPQFGAYLTDLMNATSNDHVLLVRDNYDKWYFDSNCNKNPYYDDMDVAVRVAIATAMFPADGDVKALSAKSKLAIDQAWGVYELYEKGVK